MIFSNANIDRTLGLYDKCGEQIIEITYCFHIFRQATIQVVMLASRPH